MANDKVVELIWGVPSTTVLGNTTGTTDLPPVLFDLLDTESGIILVQDQGSDSWVPQNPTLKNDGIRADSALQDGSVLLGSSLGNIVETMQCYLTGATISERSAALRKLYQFAEAARRFNDGSRYQPVYLRWQPCDAPADQFALITKIEVSFVDFDLNSVEMPEITITIEREPAWRALAPGDNPKKYAFYSRGVTPVSTPGVIVGSTTYNHTKLSLLGTIGGANNDRNLLATTRLNYDEILSSNVNYVDISANLIPGDAPALAMISWVNKGTSGANRLFIARSTRRDWYPSNNNNATTQRARNTFNGGDATLGTPAGLTVTKQVDATRGLQSNGILGTRYVLQAVTIAGAASGIIGTWQRVYAQYPARYRAFVRYAVTGGNFAEISLNISWSTGPTISFNGGSTPLVTLPNAGFGLLDMGIIDLTQSEQPLRGIDGKGADVASIFNLNLGVTHAAGVATTLRITDIVLMPFDEILTCVDFQAANLTLSPDYAAFADKTGYFNLNTGAFVYYSNTFGVSVLKGQPMELVPGVNNRLYFLADSGTPDVTSQHEVRIDIVPRWYGVRDL